MRKLADRSNTRPYPAVIKAGYRASGWRALAADGEALFDHCYGTLKARDTDSGRLANLLNVYAFCRNMSVALAFAAVVLIVGAGLGDAHVVGPGWWAVSSALAAFLLFLRYLKIYRLFHEEIFTTYAALQISTVD